MKKLSFCLLCILLLAVITLPVTAAADYSSDEPYDSYVYSSRNTPVAIPSPYSTDYIITGQSLGVGSFQNPTGLFYDGDNRVYLCDTGNNRIIITDKTFTLVGELRGFTDTSGVFSAFSAPQGVFSDGNTLYVADSGNSRIAVFDATDLRSLHVFGRPETPLLGKDYNYTPTALAADSAGCLYVIASGINQGIICLNNDGSFASFRGAPDVEPNFFELIWRNIATKEQRKQMESYVPTEYNSIFMDHRGFLYTTSQTSKTMPVAKLNANGDNVLISLKGNAKYGDKAYSSAAGEKQNPYFSDIAVFENGTYLLLDSREGKIYAYSDDGYLLYIFGANGSQKGTFRTPSALEIVGNSLAVTDSSKNTITIFSQTFFGREITNALNLYQEGSYPEAQTIWKVVSQQAYSYPLAGIQLARMNMQDGEYTKAMRIFADLGEDELYNRAFLEARDTFIRDYFFWILLGLAGFVVLVVVAGRVLKRNMAVQTFLRSDYYKKYTYGTYVMFHPFDGFWDIKREKKGNLKAALTILVLFFLIYSIQTQLADGNVIYQNILLLLPLCFYVIANWCFTTLMDGEGTLRDILIATCYSLKPYVLFGIPLLLLSEISGIQQTAFSGFLGKLIVIWIVALLIIGMMVTHDYSLSKTFIALVLTLIGICLIIFILLLLTDIAQEVIRFVYNFYKELSFRTY